MSKYTVKSFSGKFTLVAMNSPTDYFRLPRVIKFSLTYHNGRIDDDSQQNLLKALNQIQNDIDADSKLHAAHWYDDKGKVEYIETEYDSGYEPDKNGTVIESRTFPLTSKADLEAFVAYLQSLNEFSYTQKTDMYTPLLKAKTSAYPQENAEEENNTVIAEHGVLYRARSLFKCCF